MIMKPKECKVHISSIIYESCSSTNICLTDWYNYIQETHTRDYTSSLLTKRLGLEVRWELCSELGQGDSRRISALAGCQQISTIILYKFPQEIFTDINSSLNIHSAYSSLWIFVAWIINLNYAGVRISWWSCVYINLFYTFIRQQEQPHTCNNKYIGPLKKFLYSVSPKNPPPPPGGFVAIFPKRPNFTCLLFIPIYARLRIFIQLSTTLMKLCHIKSDHPACVSVDGGHFEHIMVVTLNMA